MQLQENSNVSYGVELENLNEKLGQREQEKIINPYGTTLDSSLATLTDNHNQTLAAHLAALPADLREARAAAIARQK